MTQIVTRIYLPEGRLPDGADFQGLRGRVSEELQAGRQRLEGLGGDAPLIQEKSTEAPEGTAGVPEAIMWVWELYVGNADHVSTVIAVVRGVSAAARYFGFGERGSVSISVGDRTIELPATVEDVEDLKAHLDRAIAPGDAPRG